MFTIEKKPASDALKLAKMVLPSAARANAHPFLHHVELSAVDSDVAQIRATDGETTLFYNVPNSSAFSGVVVLDYSELSRAIGASDRGDIIRIDTDGKFSAGDLTVNLPPLDRDAFPARSVAIPARDVCHTFSGSKLGAALVSVSSAMSSEETRYYLRGILIEHSDAANVTLTATDGHRLVNETIDAFSDIGNLHLDEFAGHILPDSVVKLLIALIQPGEHVVMSFDSAKPGAGFSISGNDWKVTGKSIDAQYPEYRRVIPAQSGNVSIIESEAMRKAVAKISKLKQSGAMRLDHANGRIEQGKASVKVAQFASDDMPAIAFNPAYITPMLDALGAYNVTLDAASAESPALWVPAESDRRIRGVIMPMRF